MTTITKEMIELVKDEASKLRKFTTEMEKINLVLSKLKPWSKQQCIYGLLTGDCYSPRANDLVRKCALKVYVPADPKNIHPLSEAKLNGKPKKVIRAEGRALMYHSPIEVFVFNIYVFGVGAKKMITKELIDYIKGDIDTLELNYDFLKVD